MNQEQANRVREAIRLTKLSQMKFCNGTDIDYGALMLNLWKKSKVKDLTPGLARKISQRCWEYGVDVGPGWLVFGEGNSPSLFTPTPNDAILPSESDDINHLEWGDV